MYVIKAKNCTEKGSFVERTIAKLLKEQDVKTLAVGKYFLEEGAYVSVLEYDVKDTKKFEAHERYADVQLIVTGEEDIYIAPLSAGKTLIPYNAEKDVTIYEVEGETTCVHLKEMEAAVLLPEDIHAPNNGRMGDRNKKLVFKIPVDKLD